MIAKKTALVLASLTALSGCVGPLVEVIRPDAETLSTTASIPTYRAGSRPPSPYRVLAETTTYSCKNKLWDPAATAEDAIGQLKYKAAGSNADAVVNIVCAAEGTTVSKNCWEAVICKGTLVKWDSAASTDSPRSSAAAPPGKSEESSGSGFFVNEFGQVVTNQHVVEGCANINVVYQSNELPATIVASDKINDLAVLNVARSTKAAHLRLRDSSARLAEPVVAIGYPLHGLLSSSVGVATGSISSLSGLGSDSRMVQISAPVQPGNSGGPLIDSKGSVLGVVASKLNATKVARVTGDIPQNVNFAISLRTLQNFLDSRSISYYSGDLGANSLSNAAEAAAPSVVRIRCY